jgi:ankyrin repeat protein
MRKSIFLTIVTISLGIRTVGLESNPEALRKALYEGRISDAKKLVSEDKILPYCWAKKEGEKKSIYSMLVWAVKGCHIESVEWILQYNVDINGSQTHKKTPLEIAINKGPAATDIVMLLIRKGAQPPSVTVIANCILQATQASQRQPTQSIKLTSYEKEQGLDKIPPQYITIFPSLSAFYNPEEPNR